MFIMTKRMWTVASAIALLGRTSDLDAMSEHNHKKLTKLKNVITVLYNLTCKFWETHF